MEDTTHKVEVVLPKELTVQSRGKEVVVDLAALDPKIIALAVAHGLTQKVGDSAAGAAGSAALGALGTEKAKQKANVKEWTGDEGNWSMIAQEAQRMMQATVDKLASGDWGRIASSGGGTGVSAVVKKARELARFDLKAAMRNAGKDLKQFTDLTAAAQNEKLDAMIAKEGGRDYTGDAQKFLDDAKAAVAAIDFEGLGF